MAEVRQPTGRGRPMRMRADTEQAALLAEWLNQLTEGLSVRELSERFEFNKTTWARFRNGDKLLPGWLLEELVRELVPDPKSRRLELRQGRYLLAAAEQAAADGRLAALERAMPADRLQHRLAETEAAHKDAKEVLAGMNQLVAILINLNGSISARCRQLEASDRQRRLFQERQELAEATLARARSQRHEAEALRQEAHLRAQSTPLPVTVRQIPEIELSPLTLSECDRLLKKGKEHLEQARQALTDLRSRLGISTDERLVLLGELAGEDQPAISGQDSTAETGGFDVMGALAITALFLPFAAVLIVVVYAVSVPLFAQLERALTPAGGAKPSDAVTYSCEKCIGPNHHTYSWRVVDKVESTFRPEHGLWPVKNTGPTKLKSRISLQVPRTCTGVSIYWRILADGRQIDAGVFARAPADPESTGIRVTRQLDGSPKNVTITAEWNARGASCDSFALSWSDPRIKTGYDWTPF